MEHGKDYYIREISNRSDRWGNLLLELMDRCNKSSLKCVTEEEAKAFYEEILKRFNEK